MKHGKSLQRLGLVSLTLGAVLFPVQTRCHASAAQQQEQQQSQSQPPPPPPPAPAENSQPASPQTSPPDQPAVKRKRVWTNDDVVTLRTPADNYQVEKEEKAATEAAAAAKEAAIRAAAKSGKSPVLDIKLPDTVEETEKMMKDTEDDIQQVTEVRDKMRKELPDAPEEEQLQKQKEIDRLTASLATLRRNFQALQDHLQTLSAKPEEVNPPPPPPPTLS